MTPDQMGSYAKAMVEARIIKVVVDGFAIELHPSAFDKPDSRPAYPDTSAPEPDFLFASSIPVTELETNAAPPAEAAAKP